ncbi:sulfotransferase [bacterium]|nr:sulfotransferase [bacterium]
MSGDWNRLQEMLGDALEDREKEYPAKGDAYYRLEDLLVSATDYFQTITLDSGSDRSAFSSVSQPLFLCGPPRSGTTFLSQLLDHHPEIFMMPGDSKYAIDYIQSCNLEFDSYPYQWVRRLINPTGQTPFWFIGPEEAEFIKFLTGYQRRIKAGEKDPFIAVVGALQQVIHGDKPIRYWGEKTPENELYADLLLKRFPEAKFVHLIRDPLSNIYSQKQFRMQRSLSFDIRKVSVREKLMFEAALRNLETIGPERYILLKYEDLVAEREATMREIARFLGINFDPILLTPTIKGLEASSNSSFADRRAKKSQARDENKPRWEAGLTRAEKQIIVSFMKPSAEKLGYNWSKEGPGKYSTLLHKMVAQPLAMLAGRKEGAKRAKLAHHLARITTS